MRRVEREQAMGRTVQPWRLESSMSLMVCTFDVDSATGASGQHHVPEGAASIAGFESTRTTLWGSRACVELGAVFLPRLAKQDLWVWPHELERFRAEVDHLLKNVELLAAGTRYDVDYISFRLGNFRSAALLALGTGRGVVID